MALETWNGNKTSANNLTLHQREKQDNIIECNGVIIYSFLTFLTQL